MSFVREQRSRQIRRVPTWVVVAVLYAVTLVVSLRAFGRGSPTFYRVDAVATGIVGLGLLTVWLQHRRRSARASSAAEPWWREFLVPGILAAAYRTAVAARLAAGREVPLWLLLFQMVPALALLVVVLRSLYRLRLTTR